jgi:hypothetical protein
VKAPRSWQRSTPSWLMLIGCHLFHAARNGSMLDALLHKAHPNVSGFTLSNAPRSRFDVGPVPDLGATPKSLLRQWIWRGRIDPCVNFGVSESAMDVIWDVY